MVKCKNCGFVGVRDETTRALAEVTERGRETGGVLAGEVGPFVCVAGKLDFPRRKLNWKDELDADRDCSAFCTWRQGLTPKEHGEMINVEKLAEERKEREEADRRWREAQEERARKWHEQDLAYRRADMLITLAAAFAGAVVAAIAGGVVGYFLHH